MKKKLIVNQDNGSVDKDFTKFISNLLNPSILSGIQYPSALFGDPKTFPTHARQEWVSFTINRVFERCAEKFNVAAGRSINSLEAYLLAKEVAPFVNNRIGGNFGE